MFFKKDTTETESNFLVKTCALLIHAAKIDENYTEKEEEIIKKTLLELGAKKETINQTLGKYSYPQTKFVKDNKLILSVLISNGNTSTKPVELLLHFIVSEDEN